MSKKDGKCTLIGGKNKKGFYTTRGFDEEYEANFEAAKVCPVKIILLISFLNWHFMNWGTTILTKVNLKML